MYSTKKLQIQNTVSSQNTFNLINDSFLKKQGFIKCASEVTSESTEVLRVLSEVARDLKTNQRGKKSQRFFKSL